MTESAAPRAEAHGAAEDVADENDQVCVDSAPPVCHSPHGTFQSP